MIYNIIFNTYKSKMEINYQDKVFYIENTDDLSDKELSNVSWFLIKNINEENIEQLTNIRTNIIFFGNDYDNTELKQKIKELEKNMYD